MYIDAALRESLQHLARSPRSGERNWLFVRRPVMPMPMPMPIPMPMPMPVSVSVSVAELDG